MQRCKYVPNVWRLIKILVGGRLNYELATKRGSIGRDAMLRLVVGSMDVLNGDVKMTSIFLENTLLLEVKCLIWTSHHPKPDYTNFLRVLATLKRPKWPKYQNLPKCSKKRHFDDNLTWIFPKDNLLLGVNMFNMYLLPF